jgi:hypothetical protein
MQAEAAAATTDRNFVLGALQRAAQATGADFNYLLNTATRESGLKPAAQAGTSSAAGLFQFIEQSWLGVVKTYGAKHGLNSFANAITRGVDGHYHTANPADRAAILALRKDPQVASLMEGEYAQASRATLQGSLGREVCGGELYIAHFLGDTSACRMIHMAENQPDASAAAAFPAAADANRSVFYHPDGTAKTVRDVYNWALKQPGSASALRAAPVKPVYAPAPAPALVVNGDDAGTSNTDALLASVMSWQPGHGFFAKDSDSDGATPSAPFMLTPAVMDMLSSMHPATTTTH